LWSWSRNLKEPKLLAGARAVMKFRFRLKIRHRKIVIKFVLALTAPYMNKIFIAKSIIFTKPEPKLFYKLFRLHNTDPYNSSLRLIEQEVLFGA
jgi:hypothetical protein